MNRMRTQTKQEITFMRKIQNSKHHTTKNTGSTVLGLTLLILKRYHVEKKCIKVYMKITILLIYYHSKLLLLIYLLLLLQRDIQFKH